MILKCPVRRWCPHHVLTAKVMPKTPIEELKTMLHEKALSRSHWAQNPGEGTVSRWWAELEFADVCSMLSPKWLLSDWVNDSQLWLGIIYPRNKVEAASEEAIHAEGLQVNIPSSITEIPAGAFKECNRVVTVAIPESVTCTREFVTGLGIASCLCTLQVFGGHDNPQVCDVHWRFDVRHRLGDSYAFEPATSKGNLSKETRKCAFDGKLQVERCHV